MMAGQDMDVKTVVGAITNKSDLYITVKENVQAVLNANVCFYKYIFLLSFYLSIHPSFFLSFLPSEGGFHSYHFAHGKMSIASFCVKLCGNCVKP